MKKGYTLVELLGVMIILGLILLVSFPIIINQIKKSNEALSETTRILIENSTELYINNNETNFPINPVATYYVSIATLVNEGLISKDLKDLNTNDYVKVTVNEDKTLVFEIIDSAPIPKSFATDSWETIAYAVKNGDTSVYNVGDTKEVEVTGYGTFTVRIANKSTPSECNTSGFSGTACGFVVEFVDVITTYNMNSTRTNVGGWPASAMRSFVNDTIYNALPEDLRNVIADTYVVSSHGSTETTNFTSTDKLYLLSTKEVWGKSGTSNTINYVTAEAETRQLDYYTNLGVSTSNYSGAIKYDASGSSTIWWLRSATSNVRYDFFRVFTSGDWTNASANSTYGVAPAFRLS